MISTQASGTQQGLELRFNKDCSWRITEDLTASDARLTAFDGSVLLPDLKIEWARETDADADAIKFQLLANGQPLLAGPALDLDFGDRRAALTADDARNLELVARGGLAPTARKMRDTSTLVEADIALLGAFSVSLTHVKPAGTDVPPNFEALHLKTVLDAVLRQRVALQATQKARIPVKNRLLETLFLSLIHI